MAFVRRGASRKELDDWIDALIDDLAGENRCPGPRSCSLSSA